MTNQKLSHSDIATIITTWHVPLHSYGDPTLAFRRLDLATMASVEKYYCTDITPTGDDVEILLGVRGYGFDLYSDGNKLVYSNTDLQPEV